MWSPSYCTRPSRFIDGADFKEGVRCSFSLCAVLTISVQCFLHPLGYLLPEGMVLVMLAPASLLSSLSAEEVIYKGRNPNKGETTDTHSAQVPVARRDDGCCYCHPPRLPICLLWRLYQQMNCTCGACAVQDHGLVNNSHGQVEGDEGASREEGWVAGIFTDGGSSPQVLGSWSRNSSSNIILWTAE